MSPRFILISLLFSRCLSVTVRRVASVLGDDCLLHCEAKMEPEVQYLAVRWYKVGQPPVPRLRGLVSKDLLNGTTTWYQSTRQEAPPVLVGESHSILLPNVTCSDSGLYTCHLAAPVGEKNQNGQILLTLTGCPESPAEDVLTDAFMVIFATAVLMLALIVFRISYGCLKNTLREKQRTTPVETLQDDSLRPLQKKDLMLIYTLGPKPTTKHVCV